MMARRRTARTARTARTVQAVRTVRAVALAAVLALTLVVVPDSAVQRTDMSLVDVRRAQGVDVSPHTIWILALGSDARPGQPRLRSRADAIQLVGINTRTGAATAIGIPRDSYVSIPGRGRGRINSALTAGGPRLMGRTVGNLVGIQPDYVFTTGFRGMEKMVDAIGGIRVYSPRAFSDPNLKSDGFDRGWIQLKGYGAHVFSRIRKSLPGGDFERSANQQRTLRGIQRRVRDQAHRPGFVERGVLSVMRNLDTNLPPRRLFEIAHAVAGVKPGKVTTCVVQGRVGNAGAASVVFPNVGQARRYGNQARGDATLPGC